MTTKPTRTTRRVRAAKPAREAYTGLTLPVDLQDRITEIARRHSRSRSAEIRIAVREYCERIDGGRYA